MSLKDNTSGNVANDPKISVAMGTLNGSKYMLEQLESLARQRYLPFELVVCDDGSVDDTLAILKKFKGTAPFAVKLYRNERRLGFADNFLRAARLCTGEWVSFCDQDDIWLPDKLLNCVQAIQANESAFLVLQNAYISDSELESCERIFPNLIKPGLYGPATQYGFWVWPGFLQTVRSSIFNILPSLHRPMSYYPGHEMQPHDKWICMMANAIGGIIVLPEPIALYRRHLGAVTGDYREQKVAERLYKSVAVSASHYSFLGAAAQSSASYLRKVTEICPDAKWRTGLSVAAKGFDRIRFIQNLRAELYAENWLIRRIFCYCRIFSCGGYIGPRMFAMGVLSAFKDLVFSIGLLGYLDKGTER